MYPPLLRYFRGMKMPVLFYVLCFWGQLAYGQAEKHDVLIPIAAPASNYIVKHYQPLPDGGYMLAGIVGEVTDYGNEGVYFDAFVLNVDAEGKQRYLKILGGPEHDFLGGAIPLHDGSVWCAITSYTSGGDRKTKSYGDYDIWLTKLDKTGAIVQQLCYGTDAEETALGLMLLPEGRMLLTGWVGGGKAKGNLRVQAGYSTLWAAQLDPATGKVMVEKSFENNMELEVDSYFPMPDMTADVDIANHWMGCWTALQGISDEKGNKLYAQNMVLLDVFKMTAKGYYLKENLEMGMELKGMVSSSQALAIHTADTARGVLFAPLTREVMGQVSIPPIRSAEVVQLREGGFLLWGEPGVGSGEGLTGQPTEKTILTLKDKKGNVKTIELDTRPVSEEELTPKPVESRYYHLYRYDGEGKPLDKLSVTIPGEEKLLNVYSAESDKLLLVRARYTSATEAAVEIGSPDYQLVLQLVDSEVLR